jgi:Na+/proline symporter
VISLVILNGGDAVGQALLNVALGIPALPVFIGSLFWSKAPGRAVLASTLLAGVAAQGLVAYRLHALAALGVTQDPHHGWSEEMMFGASDVIARHVFLGPIAGFVLWCYLASASLLLASVAFNWRTRYLAGRQATMAGEDAVQL